MSEIEKFDKLTAKIIQLFHAGSKSTLDFKILSKILDDFNLINYKYPLVTTNTKGVLLINQLCSIISINDLNLTKKFAILLTKLIKNQHILIEGVTANIVVQWCLEAINHHKNDEIIEILLALESLFRSKSSYHNVLPNLLATCIGDLIQDYNINYINLLALQCVEACVRRPENELKKFNDEKYLNSIDICFHIFVKYLENFSPSNNTTIDCLKVIIVCLRGLRSILPQNKNLLKNNLSLILGIIKSFMLYDIKDLDFVKPTILISSTLSIPEPNENISKSKKGGKVTKQRKQKVLNFNRKNLINFEENNNDEQLDNNLSNSMAGVLISDSDISDNEEIKMTNCKISLYSVKIRQVSLILFCDIIKLTEKHVIFSYWLNFIPENSSSSQYNLLVSLQKETSIKAKIASLNVLLLLLTSSKDYLLLAENTNQHLSYTSYSSIIALTINELHGCLIENLQNNSDIPMVETQILKCLAALVQATPYRKLNDGLIRNLIANLRLLVYNKDCSIRVTSLIVINCILSSEPILPETKDIFINNYINENSLPWIIEICLFNLGIITTNEIISDVSPVPIKLESLQMISSISQNYFDLLIIPNLELLTKALILSFSDKYLDVKLHAGKTVDFMGQAINKYCLEINGSTIKIFNQFWMELLQESLPQLISNDNAIIRVVACDCLGSIGTFCFENLSKETQLLCISLLFSCARDEDNSVKGAAVRALAISVLYPSLREDSGFIQDLAEIIYNTLIVDNVTLKIKSSWSLGNLSDCLVMNGSDSLIVREFPQKLLFNLFTIGIKVQEKNDKIKMNIVRSLGNFLQILNEDLLENDIIHQAINCLLENCKISNMKVRWNSCYAIGNCLKSSNFCKSTINWRENIFNTLTDLVRNCKNFKVRINAAYALTCISERQFYGDFYHTVWISLIDGLETSQNMEDFTEYNHRDHLVDQLIISLSHLVILLTENDLKNLENLTSNHLDCFYNYTQKVAIRILPEKSSILIEAKKHLTILLEESSIINFNNNCKITLKNLIKIYS